MNNLRILTADDEPLALRRLKILLQAMPAIDQVGEACSCSEALSAVRRLRPDVLLLDIRMRDGDGFSVVDALSREGLTPVVVFVTAFDHFALRAFESAALDYLLKPVEPERLSIALSRARGYLRAHDAEHRLSNTQEVVRNLRSALAGNTIPEARTEFWLKSQAGMTRVPIDAIESVSSEDDYIAIHTPTGSHLMRGSIRQFVKKIEPGTFVRVHKGWLARKSAIVNIRTNGESGAHVTLQSGRKIPVGRVYAKELRNSLRR